MTPEGLPQEDLTLVQTSIAVSNQQEAGVVVSHRQFQRYIDRLDECKEPLAQVWLAAVGVFVGGFLATLVALVALPLTKLAAGTKAVLLVILLCTAVLAVVCAICLSQST